MPPGPDLAGRLAAACGDGDRTTLEALLHADVTALCDGGAEEPVCGPQLVAGLLITLLNDRPGAVLTVESVNGRAGLALRRDNTVLAVLALSAADDRILNVWVVLSPAKLHHWH